MDYALGESGGKADGGTDHLQNSPEMPKKRRRKFTTDSDADFKESEDNGDESDLEEADGLVTPMELADTQANSSGVLGTSDPRSIISPKAKPQGMYPRFKSKAICQFVSEANFQWSLSVKPLYDRYL